MSALKASNNSKDVIKLFERQQKDLSHKYCSICKCVSLRLDMKPKKKGCKMCKSASTNNLIKEHLLPTWMDDNNNHQFEVPHCLSILTHAEKMLIQRVSAFIPLHHIRNGTFGLKGHVCSFEQDLGEVCNVLPRFPKDVKMINLSNPLKKKLTQK